MKLLIDILHPAHVHVFRNFIAFMKKKGHEILVTARDKDVTFGLLRAYGIDFIPLSRISTHKIGLVWELLSRTWKLFWIARRFKPDVLLGCMGPSIVPVGKLLGIPSIVFYNNETATAVNSWVQRMATAYITSTSFEGRVCGKHIVHPSYHELAYMHPFYFSPDRTILRLVGISPGERFSIVRFVSWQSSHDVGARGITDKVRFVEELARYGRVVITSEKKLPPELERYRVLVAPEKLHDLLAFATLCVGESATLAAEAACLGVPAIYIANTLRGYANELEKDYGLVYNFTSQEEGMKKIKKLLSYKKLLSEFQTKRKKMLSEKIDFTLWMLGFVEERKWDK